MFLKKVIKEFPLSDEQKAEYTSALIQTSKGNIALELFSNDAPNTVGNFAYLANSEFYDNLNFHRVIKGFMAQGGCPDKNGRGGPEHRIACELNGNPNKHAKGSLSMAHAGRDTGGSQFFLCFAPQPHLDGEHTVFGRINPKDKDSLKVLDSIEQGDIIETIKVPNMQKVVNTEDKIKPEIEKKKGNKKTKK